MKYVKNNTDNTLVFKNIVNGIQKEITFLKNSVTAISDSDDTSFKTNSKYVKMFTNGYVTYVSKPKEVYKDDKFTHYLKGFGINPENGHFFITLDKILSGENINMAYSVNGGAVTNTQVALEEAETDITHEFNLGEIESIEFRITNDYILFEVFPIFYSDRIKYYA